MGGWGSLKTQETLLNTKLVSSVVFPMLDRFESDFNIFLKTKGIKEIRLVGPVGSTAYCHLDVDESKDNTYGDIDYLFEFPFIPGDFKDHRDHQNKSMGFYKKLILEFVTHVDYLDDDSLKSQGNYLIFEVLPGQYVQVDVIASTPDVSKWALNRFLPERGIKGKTIGLIYTVLNNLYHINIGERGVVGRMKDGVFVSGNVRKGVEHIVISTDYSTFWMDILRWFNEFKGGYIFWVDGRLKISPGLNSSPDIVSQIRGLAGLINTLKVNDLIPDKRKVITDIRKEFIRVANAAKDNPKFEKAKSATAKASRRKFMDDIDLSISILNTHLT